MERDAFPLQIIDLDESGIESLPDFCVFFLDLLHLHIDILEFVAQHIHFLLVLVNCLDGGLQPESALFVGPGLSG